MTAALDDDLTFTDLFCGAGGSIRGFVDAGLTLALGANHSPRSIETVSTNHRNADFLCTDINHYDMRRLPRTRILWASVICTETSPAGGHQAHHGQGILALEELGHVPNDVYERTRACALDVIRAAEVHRYEAVVVENVVEFATKWELYDWWVDGMCRLGYRVQVVNVSAAHVHADDNAPAPQWRDRIYIVFTRTDVPLPDLERARRFWVRVNQSFGKTAGRQTGFSVTSARTVSTAVSAWSRIGRFGAVAERLQRVVFECCDAATLVERMALSADTAVYVDPPYLAETRRSRDRQRPGDYLCDMGSAEDHERLAQVLLATPAAVVLSGYPSPLYERLYADWWRISVPVRVHASNAVTTARGERTEVLWSNRPVDHGQLPFTASQART